MSVLECVNLSNHKVVSRRAHRGSSPTALLPLAWPISLPRTDYNEKFVANPSGEFNPLPTLLWGLQVTLRLPTSFQQRVH